MLNMQLLLPFVIVVIILVNCYQAAHVVFIHHVSSHSHIVASTPLAKALVRRGHNVTYIAAIPASSPDPNIYHLVPKPLKDYIEPILDKDFDISTRLEGRMPNLLTRMDKINLGVCEALLGSEEFQSWLKSTPPVDLIYVDNYPECAFGIAKKVKSKLAVFLTLPMVPKYFDSFGLQIESSSIPIRTFPYKTPLSFFDRVKNTLIPLACRLTQLYYWSGFESIWREYLGITDLPNMDEMYHDISLVLMNGHFIDENRRSLPPLFVNAPGLHVRETHDPLPKEIEEFVNSKDEEGNPSEGFVYVSLGTVVKAPKLPQNIREMFFNAMKAFPNIRFLWRWDGDFPQDNPKNLYLSKWFNQQDLLGNSKIRGFVTQAGRPSSQEAVYNGVPVVTIPIISDQDYTAEILENLGVSVNLEIGDITEEKLKSAFSTILYDKQIRQRSLEVSRIYKDLPMKPINTAVYWTEYVLRHNDLSHLKPLSIKQSWYQRRLLDVWAFITLVVVLSALLIYSILRLCFKTTAMHVYPSGCKVKVQ